MSAPSFDSWRTAQLQSLEAALDNYLTPSNTYGAGQVQLLEAMRHGVLQGGKRLRALLVLATCEALEGNKDAALRAACAVELIHAYSLIHDDMPCMDNDVLRRGKPTVHVAYGEAMALLAGDALQCLAFELLTPEDEDIPAAMQAALCKTLARASGIEGMALGQAIDLSSVGKTLTEAELKTMHQFKTGALLQASVVMGSQTGKPTAQAQRALQAYGANMGLAFQVVDDILDATADQATLGKTAGKDAANNKPTYVSILGLAASERYAHALLDQALAELDACGVADTALLRSLALLLVQREF